MNEVKDTVHLLILSSIFHYEFMFVHPFSEKEVTKGDANISTFQPEGADFKCHANIGYEYHIYDFRSIEMIKDE